MSKSSKHVDFVRAALKKQPAYVESVARAKRVYTFDAVESAMVAHAWLLDRLNRSEYEQEYVTRVVRDISENYGSSSLRDIALQAGVIIDKCWNHMHVDNPDYFDGESWDWEFVPWVCRHLPWDKIAQDNQYGHAEWEPDIPEFMAKLDAAKALGVD